MCSELNFQEKSGLNWPLMLTKEFKSGSRTGIGVGQTPQNNSSKNNTHLCKFAVKYLAVWRGGSDSLGYF